ncbi:zinc ribbon domain-containing protein [Sphingomonas radiodurans]|uniref:zinc ribbon domain-containing protein n=1 Tax=Sphingomonas radiodurans TaxID=2890321 RepID=UPI001E5DC896|nr:zinc ribbon domain-containing protein [Sphingomonas radiodurans]WBH15029.1 zinc-ribbon domain-containing protein [Sphingomonas radiodurans]
MAFCTDCGTQLPAGARFCPSCGATAASGDTVAAPVNETSRPPLPGDIPPEAVTTPPSGTSCAPPVQSAGSGGSGLAWIVPLLIVIAALAIGYTMLAPGRDGPQSATQVAGGEKGAEETDANPFESRPADQPSTTRSVDRAAADAERLSSGSATSAAALDSAFFRDPAGAASIYRGPVRVSGVIASMVQPGPTPALSMEGRTRFNYMIVNFPVGYRERLAPLAKGQFIQVACEEVRSLAGTTILDGCALN